MRLQVCKVSRGSLGSRYSEQGPPAVRAFGLRVQGAQDERFMNPKP